ncbi:MAG: acetolactate synthase small subunit [Alistipes sp. 58_9_plus]|nr:MAG: acetolactate synthase small subunit [Alistipes sp. 58_9_plus]
MEKEFIIIIFSENKVGLLSQITTVFTHRNVNIDSLTASESAIEGIYKYTIMVKNDPDRVENLVKQICYTPDEVVLQELALYKVQRSRNVEELVRRHNVRILEIHDDYIVLEKTGHRNEIQSLYRMLEPYGVYQFVRSGQVAIIKSRRELLNEYLDHVNDRYRRFLALQQELNDDTKGDKQ